MTKINILLILILLSSCAKISYIVEQGTGQYRLLSHARENKEFLADPKIKEFHKNKIKKILEYKKFFYELFEQDESDIYSKTTILKDKAVTYLLIASKFNEIKAKQECFPVVGCFPYIGFFKKKSAKEYEAKLAKEGYFTYIRPVYAYSTLGNFEDPILSSFFNYDDFDLAELIFHELFHTIFFAKDEVNLNENLANYFGKEMTLIYFKNQKDLVTKKAVSLSKSKKLRSRIVELTKSFDKRLKKSNPSSKSAAGKVLEKFMKDEFSPEIKSFCEMQNIANCYPLRRKWNNASFAAFLTYEKSGTQIADLNESLGSNLKSFYQFIQKRYDSYKDQDKFDSFEKYLLGEASELKK